MPGAPPPLSIDSVNANLFVGKLHLFFTQTQVPSSFSLKVIAQTDGHKHD